MMEFITSPPMSRYQQSSLSSGQEKPDARRRSSNTARIYFLACEFNSDFLAIMVTPVYNFHA